MLDILWACNLARFRVVGFCIVVVMAEQLVDGPPNKRQKLGAPDTPTDNAGKYNLNKFLVSV